MAGNPSLLHIQDCLSMGVVNGDILMDLISQSYNRQEKDVNKQVLFCRHLVQQQSMYPLYPASLIPLDVTRIRRLTWSCVPDIQIIATDKMKFVHDVDGVLFVAPGPLALGNGAGTYARITVYPMKKEGCEESVLNAVDRRCKVEIISVLLVCSHSCMGQQISSTNAEGYPREEVIIPSWYWR